MPVCNCDGSSVCFDIQLPKVTHVGYPVTPPSDIGTAPGYADAAGFRLKYGVHDWIIYYPQPCSWYAGSALVVDDHKWQCTLSDIASAPGESLLSIAFLVEKFDDTGQGYAYISGAYRGTLNCDGAATFTLISDTGGAFPDGSRRTDFPETLEVTGVDCSSPTTTGTTSDGGGGGSTTTNTTQGDGSTTQTTAGDLPYCCGDCIYEVVSVMGVKHWSLIEAGCHACDSAGTTNTTQPTDCDCYELTFPALTANIGPGAGTDFSIPALVVPLATEFVNGNCLPVSYSDADGRTVLFDAYGGWRRVSLKWNIDGYDSGYCTAADFWRVDGLWLKSPSDLCGAAAALNNDPWAAIGSVEMTPADCDELSGTTGTTQGDCSTGLCGWSLTGDQVGGFHFQLETSTCSDICPCTNESALITAGYQPIDFAHYDGVNYTATAGRVVLMLNCVDEPPTTANCVACPTAKVSYQLMPGQFGLVSDGLCNECSPKIRYIGGVTFSSGDDDCVWPGTTVVGCNGDVLQFNLSFAGSITTVSLTNLTTSEVIASWTGVYCPSHAKPLTLATSTPYCSGWPGVITLYEAG